MLNMDQEINDNEVLSDSQSFSLTRPASAASSDMPKMSLRSRRASFLRRPTTATTNADVNDALLVEMKDKPVRVIVVNGKCSQVFKSTLEECVEDCILEYSAEQNAVYVAKPGQTVSVPSGSTRNSLALVRELSGNVRQSARSGRRRSSINQHGSQPPSGSARGSATNMFALPSVALAASTSARLRHQLVQQKFSLVDDICEERMLIAQTPVTPVPEPGVNQSEQMSPVPDESPSPSPMPESTMPLRSSLPSIKRPKSYRERQQGFLLSDLVTNGPERYTEIFHLPRRQSQSVPRAENLSELERIKQDLFHRYLWTRSPQVSCRIRPLPAYTRRTTLFT